MFWKKSIFGVPPSSFDLSHVSPLNHAFAHNDSVYNSPLFDSLQFGFQFIEADVHLINDDIYVYHKRPIFLNKNKTLTNCYLQPLFNLIEKKGTVFSQSNHTLYLILDIKTDAVKTYEKLKLILNPFNSILTHWKNGVIKNNAVTIVLSGNRPVEMVFQEQERWVAIDGRIEDIEKNYDAQFMPMVSDKYSKVFGFSIFSKKPSVEKLKRLLEISKSIQKQGKLFRLWGIPERRTIWESLLKNGLDLISTDRIKELNDFIRSNK